jgi:glycosyltransferase involved in cell wall biosynthesis
MKIVADALRQRGHEMTVSQTFDDPDPDATYPVLGQRVCNPEPSQQWAQWCHSGRRTVFDSDDNYFAIDSRAGASYEFFQRSSVRLRLMGNAYSSTYVTTCSENLAAVWAQYCSNVVVVPNGLPAKYLERPRPVNGTPVVGWSGSSFTIHDLPLAADALKTAAQSGLARVHTIGPRHKDMVRAGVAGPGILNTGWVGPNEAYLDAVDFDIWVAPYRNTAYNQCKAPTKALEAAFLGIPIVCSDIDPYRDLVQDGVNGFIVHEPGDWEKYIGLLLREPDLREYMGQQGRRIAADHTIEKRADLWEQLLFGEKVRIFG